MKPPAFVKKEKTLSVLALSKLYGDYGFTIYAKREWGGRKYKYEFAWKWITLWRNIQETINIYCAFPRGQGQRLFLFFFFLSK